MNRTMEKFLRCLTIAAVLIMPACVKPSIASNEPIVIFAAASLKDALETIGTTYTAAGGAEVKFSFAASSILAKQIEAGNRADLFASADLKWMDYLDDKHIIRHDTRVNILGNELVVIAPATSKLDGINFSADAFLNAIGDSRIATGDVNSVPVGLYAKSALQRLDLWGVVEPKLAQADNARSALAFVARGEAPLGIVYGSDARVEKDVKVIATFPETSHDPIVYPFAVTSTSTHPEMEKILAFLKGPTARSIFEAAGFTFLIK